MANYYYTTIKSDKMTQEVAEKLLAEMTKTNRIRSFVFHEGYLSYNTRGLPDVYGILDKAGLVEEEIEIKDEFELAYESEAKSIYEFLRDEIDKYKKVMEKFIDSFELTDETKEAMRAVSSYQDQIKTMLENTSSIIIDIPELDVHIKSKKFEF